ncbi:MAG: hypothetical protein HY376_04080 [Candidatus Blackburnbacteria bacterium]|nr:hypothetical protein [Candidatus Blackburnbacteria bacterium]
MKLSPPRVKYLPLYLLLFTLIYLYLPLSAIAANAPVDSIQCFVCDSNKWRTKGGECSSSLPACKNNDESTFGGCQGGDGKQDAVCESKATPTPNSYGTEKGQQLFSPENAQKLIPYKGDSSDITDSGKAAEFFRDSTNAYAPTPSPQAQIDPNSKVLGSSIFENFFNALKGLFDEVFARLFTGGIPFFGTIYTNGANAPKLTETKETKDEFNRGVDEYIDSLNPANSSSFERGTGNPASYKEIQSASLRDIVSKAAEGSCVPGALLMAISQREAGQAFNYSDDEVKLFSATGWQNAIPSLTTRGYCYNTCTQPGVSCFRGADVRGAMQFELQTWNGLLPEIRAALKSGFGVDEEPDRCNVRDAFVGAAVKIKKDSQTAAAQCTNWDQQTVENKVANSYCQCSDTANCGQGYCTNVWNLYQSYSNLSK